MCGIIGRVGSTDALESVLNGLEHLQYRGYDSAGIAIYNGENIKICKTEGAISNLIKKAKENNLCGKICIGHTRWATHGKANEINAHPHQSESGLFTVVHNGIIENTDEIFKEKIKDKSILKSQTDTEIIAHLLEKNFKGNILETISETVKKLKGSFALGIICAENPDKIFCTAFGSPLVAARGNDCNYISSDTLALNNFAKEYINIENCEIAEITVNTIKIYNSELNEIKKHPKKIDVDFSVDDKKGYKHYMMLEIMQQPTAVKNTIDYLLKSNFDDFLKNDIENIYFVACGSAYNVGLVGKNAIEALTDISAHSFIASEFRYSNIKLQENSLVILISQSGETADTLAALRFAKQKGAKTVAIVNVKDSAIANESDFVICTKSGREIAVATTKAYSAQLIVCYYIALLLAKKRELDINEYLEELNTLDKKIQATIKSVEEKCKAIAKKLAEKDNIYFIGRQNSYAAAQEGSLKMKEITYIHAECYAAGELKHGAISLIDNATPVIAVAVAEELFTKTLSNISEVKARGGYTILITDNEYYSESDTVNEIIKIPKTKRIFTPSLSVPVLQLLSYYTALELGRDIDKPKNLAKSVTVE